MTALQSRSVTAHEINNTIGEATNLKCIIADQTSNGTVKTEGYSKAAKISAVTVDEKNITKATSSTDGSLPITLTYSVDVYGSDEKTTTQTATSTLTGVIPKTKQQNDATYEAKIEAAIEAATWTSDDFDATGTTDLSAKGYQKLYNLIKGVDNNTLVAYNADSSTISGIGSASAAAVASLDGKVNIGRYTAGTHGKDGAATVSFYAARNDGADKKVDSFSVKLTVVEGDGHVQDELEDAFNNGVAAAAKSLQKDPVADQDAAVKVIKDAIDAELAKTYNDKAYSEDIDSYEVVVPKDQFTASTTTDNGEIKFYVKVNTGRTSSEDSTKKDVWYFVGRAAVSATPWYSADINYDSTLTSDTAAAAATYLIDIKKLAKAVEVDATSIALPSAISYNVKVAGADSDDSKVTGIKLKDYLTINPDGANTYKIRWTNSNSKFTLSDGTNNFGDSYIITASSTDNNSATLPVLKYLGSGTATTTIKADLLDADGNTVSSASAVVTALSGFDDVQNKSYFAYDAINALASTLKKEAKTGERPATKTVNNGNYNTSVDLKDNETISSSPVIQGTGSNKFDPYTDVTRAQFVTFLYRNACNEYTFTSTGYDKDPASYTATTKFSDVAADKYYAKAVAWAVDNGIVNGKTDTTFAPDAKITRAEAVTMIYRLQANGSNYSNWQSFTDVDASAYYANAVGYAANYKITNGKTPTTFAPNDNVTRGEAAAFIFRAVAGEDGFYISAD